MRLDLITIFPDYFAPLDLSLIGKARERGDLSGRGARPAQMDRRRASHGRRQPLRRRPRNDHEARAVGRALRVTGMSAARAPVRRPIRPARVVMPTPAGRPFDQAYAHGAGRASSVAGLLLRPLRGDRCAGRRCLGGRRDQRRRLRARRGRGRCARHGRGRRPPAAGRARQRRIRGRRLVRATGCWRRRPTPGLRNGRGWPFRRCCAPVIMGPSRVAPRAVAAAHPAAAARSARCP